MTHRNLHLEPLPAYRDNPHFATSFSPFLDLPGFFPGAGGFFHGCIDARPRVLIFGSDFGQLSYQQELPRLGGEPPGNATISNLGRVLADAGLPKCECFLANAVLCTWKLDNAINNHAHWRHYTDYVAACADWHRRFILRHQPVAIVFMGTSVLKTFGKYLSPELRDYWKSMQTLKDVYAAGRETFRSAQGTRLLVIPHASLWYPNEKKAPEIGRSARSHLREISSMLAAAV